MLFLGDVPAAVTVIPVGCRNGCLQPVNVQAVLVDLEITMVPVRPDDELPVILIGRIGTVLLTEAEQVVLLPCLIGQHLGCVKVIMCMVVVCRIVALRPVIDGRHDDFLGLLDVKAPVLPVIDRVIPSHRRLLHNDIHTVGQIAGDVVIPVIQTLIRRKGRVILIRPASRRTVPFHAIDGVQVVVVEGPQVIVGFRDGLKERHIVHCLVIADLPIRFCNILTQAVVHHELGSLILQIPLHGKLPYRVRGVGIGPGLVGCVHHDFHILPIVHSWVLDVSVPVPEHMLPDPAEWLEGGIPVAAGRAVLVCPVRVGQGVILVRVIQLIFLIKCLEPVLARVVGHGAPRKCGVHVIVPDIGIGRPDGIEELLIIVCLMVNELCTVLDLDPLCLQEPGVAMVLLVLQVIGAVAIP